MTPSNGYHLGPFFPSRQNIGLRLSMSRIDRLSCGLELGFVRHHRRSSEKLSLSGAVIQLGNVRIAGEGARDADLEGRTITVREQAGALQDALEANIGHCD